jgi:adenylate cyclase
MLPQTETRKLAAIMFTDIVGFSRQMGVDETRMLRLLDVHNQLIQHAVATHHGTVIKTVGDAFLVDFPSVVHAVQCAQQIQAQFRTHNAEKESAEQIHVRIGIHLGDIVQKDGDVFGDGVNIASRLQDLAEPDTICLSDVVYRDVAKKMDLGTVVSLGKPKLKNIVERFSVYALLSEAPQGIRQTLRVQHLKLSRRLRPVYGVLAGVLVVLSVGGLIATQAPFLFSVRNPQLPIHNQATLPLPDKPSIVVLPFDNMSKDPEQDYFSNGITEVLTADLSRIASLFVIARNTAFTYKGKTANVQDVGRELGVRYALEGSVQKTSGQVRIVAQLIDTTTGGHLWSERYDRPLTDIFALQDDIVQKIVTTLKLQLTLQEQGWVVHKTTDNLEAYDTFLRAYEYCCRFTKDSNAKGRQLYEKALALDPMYAEAYAGLGVTYLLDWIFQWSQDPQTLQHALELAQKAIAIDDSVPRAHWILGAVYLWMKQYDQAITATEQAIALDPNFADGYALGLAEIFMAVGRSAEAVGLVEKAMRLNPRSPPRYFSSLGRAYRLLGRYEEAIAALKEALVGNPNLLYVHFQLAGIYSELGREEEARAAAAEVLRLNPNFSLDAWKQQVPFKDPTIVERWVAAARKAGLK